MTKSTRREGTEKAAYVYGTVESPELGPDCTGDETHVELADIPCRIDETPIGLFHTHDSLAKMSPQDLLTAVLKGYQMMVVGSRGRWPVGGSVQVYLIDNDLHEAVQKIVASVPEMVERDKIREVFDRIEPFYTYHVFSEKPKNSYRFFSRRPANRPEVRVRGHQRRV